MKNKFIDQINDFKIQLNIVQFELLFAKYENEIYKIYVSLLNSGLDKQSLGFWIYDIENDIEYYSPKFRESLGFESVNDFPNIPSSWQSYIFEEDHKIAIENFVKHINSKGEFQYIQKVRYWKKNRRDSIEVTCHGKIVSWLEDGSPKLMIGVHL